MPIEMIGDYPEIDHVPTGLFTLDRALGGKEQVGMPDRSIYEIYGYEHSGKSTLAYFLIGLYANHHTIDLCDLEGCDKDYVLACLNGAGFDGTVKLIAPVDKVKKAPRRHNEMLQETTHDLRADMEVRAVLVDSIGVIIPTAEEDGDLEDANMGRRAKLVAQFSRRCASHLMTRPEPAIVIATNHEMPILGGHGNTTPGGTSMKFLSGCRLCIRKKEELSIGPDDKKVLMAVQMRGDVAKLRYGGEGRKFSVVNLLGTGINRDLTALFDCFVLELAVRSTTVKIGKKSVARLSTLIEAAQDGKHEKFDPFYEELQIYDKTHPFHPGDVLPTVPDFDDTLDVPNAETST